MQTPDLDAVQRAVGDRYEVLSLAGVGGMGAVFRARHRTLGHIVAVKVLPPDVAASTMRHERFRREATLGASLDHPNIVRVYDFDTREGISFLIMTFVRGDTFEERLRGDARVPTDHILRMVREIADALGYAHRRGIVHRDVKPSNILLDEDSGRALLADFGIARVEGAGESSLTQPGAAIGTPGYMAPEQAASGRVDGRADLHSLAAVAFEALGGGPAAFKADRAGLVRALRTARPDLSAGLAAALAAPLAEQPDDRPATAAAWLAALARAEVRPWRPWAAAGVLAVGSAVALRLLLAPHRACRLPHDAPARLAVMPFAILGTPPYPASQLPEYFISRFRPVEHLSEVVSFGRVVAQIASEHPSNEEAQALACRLGAKFFVQGSVAYVGPTVTLQATLYEGGRARRSAKAEGRVGAEESEMMDRVWTGLYPEFTPGADATLPNGGPEALAAYLNAEAALHRAGTELPPGVVRARRVLLSLRRPVRRDGRRGRGRVQPRPRSRSAVRAGHRTLDLAGAPGRRPARDGGPDSPLLAYRLNVSRGRSSGHRRHTHPRLRSGPARAAPHRVPAQLPGAGVPRLPGG